MMNETIANTQKLEIPYTQQVNEEIEAYITGLQEGINEHTNSFHSAAIKKNLVGLPMSALPYINVALAAYLRDDPESLFYTTTSVALVTGLFTSFYTWFNLAEKPKNHDRTAYEYGGLLAWINHKMSYPEANRPGPDELITEIRLRKGQIDGNAPAIHPRSCPLVCGVKIL